MKTLRRWMRKRRVWRMCSPVILLIPLLFLGIVTGMVKLPQGPESGLIIVLFYLPVLCVLLAIDFALKLFTKTDAETLWFVEVGLIMVAAVMVWARG